MTNETLELADWRRRVAALYVMVRAEPDSRRAHEYWRAERDDLFCHHPQSPLPAEDPLRSTGLPYWPYDPQLRVEAVLEPGDSQTRVVPTSSDGEISLRQVGRLDVAEFGFSLDVWWLAQYAGGLFVPLRDGTAATDSYGGGRYLLDSAKSADLGAVGDRLILDFNFLYHPSCRYNPRWECPLAPPGNTTTVPIRGGERLAGT